MIQRLKTTLTTITILSMGFYFGSQYTGRKAQSTYMGQMPEWLQHVKTVNTVVLAIFAVSILAVILIDYMEQSN